MKKVVVKKNRYVDSVSLMSVSDRVTVLPGVTNVEAQMGTHANLELLQLLGYEVPEGTTPNDLAIAITADTEEQYAAAYQLVEDIIDRKNVKSSKSYSSLEDVEGQYDLCQISLPG